MTARMCDGQPYRECASGCGIDCQFNSAERAHLMAAREFFEPELRVQMFDKPSLLNRCLDWLGNLPHRFGRWVDRTKAGRLFCLSVGVVLAGGMAVSFLVGFAK